MAMVKLHSARVAPHHVTLNNTRHKIKLMKNNLKFFITFKYVGFRYSATI